MYVADAEPYYFLHTLGPNPVTLTQIPLILTQIPLIRIRNVTTHNWQGTGRNGRF